MFENLKKFFTQSSDVSAMAQLDAVKSNVPADAVYVTVSPALAIKPPSQLLKLAHSNFMPVMADADRENTPMQVVYAVHNGHDLKLVRDGRTILSVPLTDIDVLHRFGAGGFVLNLKNGDGIAFSTPLPVKTDASTKFRTIHGMTDMTGGWLKELEPFGVRVFD
jgi:hypothetical protein